MCQNDGYAEQEGSGKEKWIKWGFGECVTIEFSQPSRGQDVARQVDEMRIIHRISGYSLKDDPIGQPEPDGKDGSP